MRGGFGIPVSMATRKRAVSGGRCGTPPKRSRVLTPPAGAGPSFVLRSPREEQRFMVKYALRSIREQQEAGAERVGVLLAAEMGSGKTGAALMIGRLLQAKLCKPMLFVCTVSILSGVVDECTAFFGNGVKVQMIESSSREKRVDADTFLVVTNRETLGAPELSGTEWGVVVLDEAHDLRNRDTERYRTVLGLRDEVRVLLTGTPINNGAEELVSLLEQAHLVSVPEEMGAREFMLREGDSVLDATLRGCVRVEFDPGCGLERTVHPIQLLPDEAEAYRVEMESASARVQAECSFYLFTHALNLCSRSPAKLRAVNAARRPGRSCAVAGAAGCVGERRHGANGTGCGGGGAQLWAGASAGLLQQGVRDGDEPAVCVGRGDCGLQQLQPVPARAD